MNHDASISDSSWGEVYKELCRPAPSGDELELGRAGELISQQRESQVPVLAREMYSPVFETTQPITEGSGEETHPRDARFQFSDAGHAATTFLGVAAQAGAGLLPFGFERLGQLAPADVLLGRLLLLLATAEEREQGWATQGDEWAWLFESASNGDVPHPFGLVLTPMVLAVVRGAPGKPESEAILSLVAELGGTDRTDELIQWATRVVAAGAEQLVALGGRGLMHWAVAIQAPPVAVVPRGVHARDIILPGSRKANEGFLDKIREIPGVEAQTRFIYEPQPDVVRIRTWSDEPLADDYLNQLAEDAGTPITEILDDTIM